MAFAKLSKLKITRLFHNYDIFLRWWLFFSIVSFGTFTLFLSGLIQQISQGDITKISFLIYGVFVIFTIRTGTDTYRLSREDEKKITPGKINYYSKRSEVGWFISDIMLTLGMIGTVVGFIYMLGTSFSDVNPGSANSMRGVLVRMSIGMSTALYTTAAGLVCSLLLKLQLFNLSNHLNFISGTKEVDHAP